ncbi:MAG: hypothetical protein E7041_05355 [Lentisphaerae bacterium]|nr:hypothetical protein [Lentisphaerota bacterium]
MDSTTKNYFDFQCPHCQAAVMADREWQGMNTECPSCGKQIVIPTCEKQIVIPVLKENKIKKIKSFLYDFLLKVNLPFWFLKPLCFIIAFICLAFSAFYGFTGDNWTTDRIVVHDRCDSPADDMFRSALSRRNKWDDTKNPWRYESIPMNDVHAYTAVCAGYTAKNTAIAGENAYDAKMAVRSYGKSIVWMLFALFFLLTSMFAEKILPAKTQQLPNAE